MRRASFRKPSRRCRGQSIYVFMLGLAMAALIVTNVFVAMEYFLDHYEQENVAAKAEKLKEMGLSGNIELPTPTPVTPTQREAEKPAEAPKEEAKAESKAPAKGK